MTKISRLPANFYWLVISSLTRLCVSVWLVRIISRWSRPQGQRQREAQRVANKGHGRLTATVLTSFFSLRVFSKLCVVVHTLISGGRLSLDRIVIGYSTRRLLSNCTLQDFNYVCRPMPYKPASLYVR
jgi:L-asparagine transporter-like permease